MTGHSLDVQKIQCQLFRFIPADTGAPMISAEDVGPLTPQDVRPLEKVESRKKIGKSRRWKKGTTTILTDSLNLKALKEKKGSFREEKS
ncbi:hypothetical protein AVEN_149607-1 [Araneus ventricosus]|uniref:Uncharacterized protein n=1 Tax=Araneus ventricosus TaxID=182803 RepID=A0A4Y2KXV3_ARAVE|nr:hypothetical protein AVEN_149607-1 [Araneus ventricosus]